MTQTHLEHGSAIFSQDRRYRYLLTREWDDTLPMLCWIGLNPSVADADKLDPTLRRVIGFAKRDGYGSVLVGNAFALVTPYPRVMRRKGFGAVGPDNNRQLLAMAYRADRVVVGWGVGGAYLGRGEAVDELLTQAGHSLWCWGHTKEWCPAHPLYLPKDVPLQRY